MTATGYHPSLIFFILLATNFVVERCVFESNRAQDSGGGVYINLSGVNGAYANITFQPSNFSRILQLWMEGGLR